MKTICLKLCKSLCKLLKLDKIILLILTHYLPSFLGSNLAVKYDKYIQNIKKGFDGAVKVKNAVSSLNKSVTEKILGSASTSSETPSENPITESIKEGASLVKNVISNVLDTQESPVLLQGTQTSSC